VDVSFIGKDGENPYSLGRVRAESELQSVSERINQYECEAYLEAERGTATAVLKCIPRKDADVCSGAI
jgi:hypothetical protein